MEFGITERGPRKLCKNGYQQVKQKNLANGLTSWDCFDNSCKVIVKETVRQKLNWIPWMFLKSKFQNTFMVHVSQNMS